MWRIVASERFSCSLSEVLSWSLFDVEKANLTLDILEDADTLAAMSS